MYSLRPVTDTDLPLLLEWRNQPEIREKMYTRHVISEAEHYAYFERIKNDPTKKYFLCVDHEGTPVGVVNFGQIDLQNHNAFWGFYSGDMKRRGIGTQMAYLALNYAFDVLSLHKLSGEVLSTNTPSLEFHKKVGFQTEGVFREHYLAPTGYLDIYRLAILKDAWNDEWRARTAARLQQRASDAAR